MKTKIPFFKEITGDLDSPLEIYLKFKNDKNSYFFESVEGGDKWARYSIIGLPTDKKISLSKNPLDQIDDFLKSIDVKKNKALPEFHGGLVGYFSYETIREIEGKLKKSTKPKLKYDDISLMISDEVIIFDNIKKSLFIVVNGQEDEKSACLSRIDEIHNKLLEPSKDVNKKTKNKINFSSSVAKGEYLNSIKKIKDYIVEGDVMQVVYGPVSYTHLTLPTKA